MSVDLHRERAYFLDHQSTLTQLYAGKVVVIKGDVVLGSYDDDAWASPQVKKRYAGGGFLIQRVAASAAARAPEMAQR